MFDDIYDEDKVEDKFQGKKNVRRPHKWRSNKSKNANALGLEFSSLCGRRVLHRVIDLFNKRVRTLILTRPSK
jgi:hypothetical protein